MQLNILLRGQSNAQLLAMSKDWPAVATEVEKLLGFDGVTNTVNLLEKMNSTSNDNTLVGGTAFVGDWVKPSAGGWQQGWTNNTLETGLLNYINELPASERSVPTAVLWLHNEYDSTNPSLTTAEWTSAVRFEAQQVRQALGQSAATVPYVFVNAIPYGSNSIGSVNQAIKQGMAQLAADPSFNAVVGVQSDDLNMDGTFYGTGGTPGVYGGPHMSASDVTLIDQRVALAVAQTFASYAQPGSPVALGQVDAYGPEAVSAKEVGSNQILVSASLDHASLSTTLDADAAHGIGWSILDNGQTLAASAAQVTSADQVLLTFGATVPTDATARLYYGYGYGRFATSDSDPGQGNAIYDTQQMPLWAPASGLVLTAACYAAGTRIATADGDVAIERLRVGSRVVAVADGRATLRPVRWIGRARVDLDRHPYPAQVAPVRVRAGAFADGTPRRDLLLSPDHAVFLNGALIPVRLLLNGATIVQNRLTGGVRYFHVELDSHDVLLAEGLAAESYLDTGNRNAFDNGGAVQALHPDFSALVWKAHGCAPLLLGGDAVARAWSDLRARAESLGYRLTTAPSLRVLTDGIVVPARPASLGRWSVRLPPGTRDVRLLSRSFVPEHIDRRQDDRRRLGLALTAIAIDGHPVALTDAALASGVHGPERDDTTAWRWTDGDALLRLRPMRRARTLELQAASWGRYWRPPHRRTPFLRSAHAA